MDYLQYVSLNVRITPADTATVLNLIVNGLPSIR